MCVQAVSIFVTSSSFKLKTSKPPDILTLLQLRRNLHAQTQNEGISFSRFSITIASYKVYLNKYYVEQANLVRRYAESAGKSIPFFGHVLVLYTYIHTLISQTGT